MVPPAVQAPSIRFTLMCENPDLAVLQSSTYSEETASLSLHITRLTMPSDQREEKPVSAVKYKVCMQEWPNAETSCLFSSHPEITSVPQY